MNARLPFRVSAAGRRGFPGGDGGVEVGEVALQGGEVFVEFDLQTAVELRTFFLGQCEAPSGGAAVGAEFAFGVAAGGAEFLNGAAQAAQRGVGADLVVGGVPLDFEAGQPIGVAGVPGLLDLVPEVFAGGRPFAASVGVQVLHEAAVDVAGVGGRGGGPASAPRIVGVEAVARRVAGDEGVARVFVAEEVFEEIVLGIVAGVVCGARRWFGFGRVVAFPGFGIGFVVAVFLPDFFDGPVIHRGFQLRVVDVAGFAQHLGVEFAEGGDELGKRAVQPAFVGGRIRFFVTAEVAGGFLGGFAGGVEFGPGGVAERGGVDEDERAAG